MLSIYKLFELSPSAVDSVVQNHIGTPREQEAKTIGYLSKIKEKAPQSYQAQKPILMYQIKQSKIS